VARSLERWAAPGRLHGCQELQTVEQSGIDTDADRMCHESAIAGRVDELKAAREARD